jgi:hypothetical protein
MSKRRRRSPARRDRITKRLEGLAVNLGHLASDRAAFELLGRWIAAGYDLTALPPRTDRDRSSSPRSIVWAGEQPMTARGIDDPRRLGVEELWREHIRALHDQPPEIGLGDLAGTFVGLPPTPEERAQIDAYRDAVRVVPAAELPPDWCELSQELEKLREIVRRHHTPPTGIRFIDEAAMPGDASKL